MRLSGNLKLEDKMSEKETGTVKWFSDTKGFGFISHASGQDVFVHFSNIDGIGLRTLYEGQRVEFFIEHGPKGMRAVDVKVVG